jgi:AmmeMemoRadiSam system protein B
LPPEESHHDRDEDGVSAIFKRRNGDDTQAGSGWGVFDADPAELRESIDASFLGPFGPGRLPLPAPIVTRDIVGLVCPHAGYMFSGSAAAAAFAELADDGLPDSAVIIGPNHRGDGAPAAIMSSGTWQTPLGDVEIDSETAAAIRDASGLVQEDETAHLREHSVEVQIPFLQYLSPRIRIVPILLSIRSREDGLLFAENVGKAIAEAVDGKNAVVIASTDFTHYETKHTAEQQDEQAMSAIARLDYSGLLDIVERKGISMCGVVPTAAAIVACLGLGAKRAERLAYYTSGDIIGETSQVVGYGSLKMVKGLF